MNTQDTTKTANREPEYTINDIGCYVDSSRGVYVIDRIATIAVNHGFRHDPEDIKAFDAAGYTFSEYEFANEIENEIDSFMNDNYGVDDAYWGRNENGDWGLWTIE